MASFVRNRVWVREIALLRLNENRDRVGRLTILALILAQLVIWPFSLNAQQSFEIPLPPNQSNSTPLVARPTPRSAPTPPGMDVETLPQLRQAPPPPPPAISVFRPPPAAYQPPPSLSPPASQAPPPLPASFRGCWEGEVDYLDSIERLPGAAKIGPWTPKTYRLCYRQSGNGPFELTFTEAGVAHSRKITNAAGKMQVLSTDGRSFANLRALLHFDEYRTHTSYFSGNTFPVDELTNLQCRITPDGMQVSGTVYGERSGNPWFRAKWHALFARSQDLPPVPE
jgi:hypothetical protein